MHSHIHKYIYLTINISVSMMRKWKIVVVFLRKLFSSNNMLLEAVFNQKLGYRSQNKLVGLICVITNPPILGDIFYSHPIFDLSWCSRVSFHTAASVVSTSTIKLLPSSLSSAVCRAVLEVAAWSAAVAPPPLRLRFASSCWLPAAAASLFVRVNSSWSLFLKISTIFLTNFVGKLS